MTAYNTWLPSDQFYDFNDGVSSSLGYQTTSSGGNLLCRSFTIPNAQAGFGVTMDQINPAFAITKPPKVSYSSTSDMAFVIKDADGWLWVADCPKQDVVKERGWAWNQFILFGAQENEGNAPAGPAEGNIQAFQFSGAAGVHGETNMVPQTVRIAYIAGRSPKSATSGTIRQVILTDRNPDEHEWKVGTIDLVNGTRTPVKYIGSLPFGLQINGPRNRLSVLPYRGPIVAGYQSGTPWVGARNNEMLSGMLEFMLEAQEQFTFRSPTNLVGPWMHIYLQALWDCEQNGQIDTWVWDGPDGNPAWDGWQYRTIDSMGRTWHEAMNSAVINTANREKLEQICTRFLDWLFLWFSDNPDVGGVPNDWKPIGWTQGTPFPADSYLEPKYNAPSAHDNALALKGALFSTLAGYDLDKGRYLIHRLLGALLPLQYTDETGRDDMRGAFTQNPEGFEVYGFEQGEIMEALALCKQHPELLTPGNSYVG